VLKFAARRAIALPVAEISAQAASLFGTRLEAQLLKRSLKEINEAASNCKCHAVKLARKL
jgi:hypothetical protein